MGKVKSSILSRIVTLLHVQCPEYRVASYPAQISTLFLHTIAGHDFEAVDSTIILTKEDLYKIKDDPTHQYIAVPISLTEDDYIEPSQTFTLTLEVQSTLDFGEGITSATFTITNEGSDSKCMFSKRG